MCLLGGRETDAALRKGSKRALLEEEICRTRFSNFIDKIVIDIIK